MTDLTPAALDELERLRAASTPGEWIDVGHTDLWPGVVMAVSDEHEVPVCVDPEADDRPADRACTAALHNAAPSLIAAARDLAWHEDRHGTRAEQEAEDADLASDLARIDALSDEECIAELKAEGIDYDAARKKIDVTLKLCAERADLKRGMEALRAERDELRATLGKLSDLVITFDREAECRREPTGSMWSALLSLARAASKAANGGRDV